MQDPKHRAQMLRSPLKPSWLVAEKSEMDGLYRRKCWVKVLRSSLTPQDKIFSTRFHYKIKRKDGQFEKCKVSLVIQGQHMRRKDDTGAGDFEDAFSPVPHASGFRTILSLATQHHMLCDHVDIVRIQGSRPGIILTCIASVMAITPIVREKGYSEHASNPSSS